MLDGETEVRVPHAATKTRKGTTIDDPRTSVAMHEQCATITLFFDPEKALAGTAPLLEVRLSPAAGGTFEPWKLMPQVPLYLRYARASLTHQDGDAMAALRALRQVTSTRRGLSDDFLRLVAQTYESLVAEGEPSPVKTLAELQQVTISATSRWISAARARGFLPTEKDKRRAAPPAKTNPDEEQP